MGFPRRTGSIGGPRRRDQLQKAERGAEHPVLAVMRRVIGCHRRRSDGEAARDLPDAGRELVGQKPAFGGKLIRGRPSSVKHVHVEVNVNALHPAPCAPNRTTFSSGTGRKPGTAAQSDYQQRPVNVLSPMASRTSPAKVSGVLQSP